MKRFASDQDRWVYQVALNAPPGKTIGHALTCQFEARVDFGSGGAIVSEDERGAVRVTYYGNVGGLKAAWIDTVHAHADCCLYVAAAA